VYLLDVCVFVCAFEEESGADPGTQGPNAAIGDPEAHLSAGLVQQSIGTGIVHGGAGIVHGGVGGPRVTQLQHAT